MNIPRRDIFNPEWEKSAAARAILDAAVAKYDPSHVFGLFSGGHDSLCAVHVASQHPRFSGAVSLFTGVGVRASRRYVYETCKRYAWPLHVYRPLKGDRYHEIVEQYGFPGKHQHSTIYNRLKERQIDRLIREHKTRTNDRILLVSGVRAQESTRRMGRAKPIDRNRTRVWVAPIIDWDAADKNDYINQHDLPRNEVVDILHRSGECNCGAFGSPAELEELRFFFPDDAEKIDLLAVRIRERFGWGWGESPPEKAYPVDEQQMDMRLCSSCVARGAA